MFLIKAVQCLGWRWWPLTELKVNMVHSDKHMKAKCSKVNYLTVVCVVFPFNPILMLTESFLVQGWPFYLYIDFENSHCCYILLS